MSCWPSLIFINLRLWRFKKQKLTALYQRLNYFRNVYRKDRTINGGGVMLLVHKDIPHCPSQNWTMTQSQFGSNLLHFVASWYRPPNGHLPVSDNGNDLLNSLEKFDNLIREQLDKIKNINKGNNPTLSSRFR